MRIETGTDFGSSRPGNTVECEAPPWIESVTEATFGSGPPPTDEMADLWISRAEPSTCFHVIFDKKEWSILKARVDAFFVGEDPNREEFYVS